MNGPMDLAPAHLREEGPMCSLGIPCRAALGVSVQPLCMPCTCRSGAATPCKEAPTPAPPSGANPLNVWLQVAAAQCPNFSLAPSATCGRKCCCLMPQLPMMQLAYLTHVKCVKQAHISNLWPAAPLGVRKFIFKIFKLPIQFCPHVCAAHPLAFSYIFVRLTLLQG